MISTNMGIKANITEHFIKYQFIQTFRNGYLDLRLNEQK